MHPYALLVAARLLVAPAEAKGELVVNVDRPCVVVVNMRPYPTTGESIRVEFDSDKTGSQNVRIRNLLGEQTWAGRIEVPDGYRVELKWELGHMNVGDPSQIKAHLPKLSDRGLYFVNGELVTGPERRDPAEIRAGAKADPAAPASSEDPFLSAVADASTEGGGGGVPVAEAAPPPAEGGTGKVKLHNRNGSWANAWIDGTLHEFRGGFDLELTLPSGVHRVEFKDFRDKEVWWSGDLWVWADTTFELQFSQAAPPASLDRPEAWHP